MSYRDLKELKTRSSHQRATDWSSTQMFVRMPNLEGFEDSSLLRSISQEQLMTLEDRSFAYVGDDLTVVIGLWFRTQYSLVDIQKFARTLDSILVSLEPMVGRPDEPDALMPRKEPLVILSRSPWTHMKPDGDSEMTLLARTVTLAVRTRFTRPEPDACTINVRLKQHLPRGENADLGRILDEALNLSTPGTAFIRNVAKKVTLRSSVEFEQRTNVLPGKEFVLISAKNLRSDRDVAILPPVIHLASSRRHRLDQAPEDGMPEGGRDSGSVAGLYNFRPLFDVEPLPREEVSQQEWDELDALIVGLPYILHPGEVFDFVYDVERKVGSHSRSGPLIMTTPVTIPWSVCRDTEDGWSDRAKVSTEVVHVTWRSTDIGSDVQLHFSGPEAVAPGEEFTIQIVAWNNTSRDVEKAVLQLEKGTLLPLRSRVALGKIFSGGSVVVAIPLVAHNCGVAHLDKATLVGSGLAWSAPRPYQVFVGKVPSNPE